MNLGKNYIYKHLPLIILVIFALLQFLLILRHKSPYISDSYFYKHIFYTLQGADFDSARLKVISQVDLQNADKIALNIFQNKETYEKAYSLFDQRLIYPIAAIIFFYIFQNEFIAFLMPVLLAYIGVVTLFYGLARTTLKPEFALLALALFISFNPFLDWSTYFLSDTIGLFFWFACIYFAYSFIGRSNKKALLLFTVAFAISLLNREQGLLLFPSFVILSFFVIKKFTRNIRQSTFKLVTLTGVTAFFYLFLEAFLSKGSLSENLNYIHNNYGLTNYSFSLVETIIYIKDSMIANIKFLLRDIVRHHWWFTIFVIGLIGIVKIIITKHKNLSDIFLVSTGFASFLFILWPSFSYRLILATVAVVIIFACKTIEEYFSEKRGI